MTNRRDPASYAHPTDRFREPSELDMVDDWRPTREDRENAERTHGPLMEALDRAVASLATCQECGEPIEESVCDHGKDMCGCCWPGHCWGCQADADEASHYDEGDRCED